MNSHEYNYYKNTNNTCVNATAIYCVLTMLIQLRLVILHMFIFLVTPTATIKTARERTITEQKVVASSTTGSLAYDRKWHANSMFDQQFLFDKLLNKI